MYFNLNKVQKLYSIQETPAYPLKAIERALKEKEIPPYPSKRKSWSLDQLPAIGEKFGFIAAPTSPKVICVFVTKGGVLKSTLTLNLARMTALHNIKTCVVGLDMQSDITTALGFSNQFEEADDFATAVDQAEKVKGLPDVFFNQTNVLDLIQSTDIPTLDYIPETPELVAMERALALKNKREYWLEKFVTEPLLKKYDLIFLDASPNWNLLTTNALVASNLLLSPLECKINNFRNFKMFDRFISEFRWDMNLHFEHLYVPTRLNPQRKLSREIFEWYTENLNNCSKNAIIESAAGEEATALNRSVSEYSPGNKLALSINSLLKEVMILIDTRNQKSYSKSISDRNREIHDGTRLE